MDPITIAIALGVVVLLASGGNKTPVQLAEDGQRLGTMPVKAGPAPEQVPEVAGAIFDGARGHGASFRRQLDETLVNVLATAKQRATSLSGGMDPAFVDSGSAQAARGFVTRGLATSRDAAVKVAEASWAMTVPGLVARTQTGQAIQTVAQEAVGRTAAEVVAAGGTVADATQQAAANVAATAANAATNADASTAQFILRNKPF